MYIGEREIFEYVNQTSKTILNIRIRSLSTHVDSPSSKSCERGHTTQSVKAMFSKANSG
jgi:hypothetical protein